MIKNLLFILAIVIIGCVSCKQEAYKIVPPSSANSYFPETRGSTWKYRDSIYGEKTDNGSTNVSKIDTVTITITGATTDINAAVCYNANVVSKQSGSSVAYYYSFKHVFAVFEQTATLGLTNLEFLIDNFNAGQTWQSVPTKNTLYNGSPARALSTVQEKNITKIVGGKTFTDVIHTSVLFQVNVSNTGFKSLANFDFYTARGVGIIEKDISVYGYLNATETIMDYTIAPD